MSPLSTRTLDALPAPPALWRRSIALAALDRLLGSSPHNRVYRFDPAWGPGQHVASMSNGSGDDYLLGFCGGGVFLRGFDHESPMSPYNREVEVLWEGLFDGFPSGLEGFRRAPGFRCDEVTFAVWWDASDPGWRKGVERYPEGEDPDGSVFLLQLLGAGPEGYVDFARSYYERELPLEPVRALYDHAPLTPELLQALAADPDVEAARGDVLALGYGQPYPFA